MRSKDAEKGEGVLGVGDRRNERCNNAAKKEDVRRGEGQEKTAGTKSNIARNQLTNGPIGQSQQRKSGSRDACMDEASKLDQLPPAAILELLTPRIIGRGGRGEFQARLGQDRRIGRCGVATGRRMVNRGQD